MSVMVQASNIKVKRWVFICPGVPGGVKSFLTNLSVYLTREGIEHLIIMYGSHDGVRTKVTEGDLPHSVLLSNSQYSTPRSAFRAMTKLFREDDVLICNDSAELEAISDSGMTNPVIFILHGDLNHYDAILRKYPALIDEVICVSNGLKEKYSGKYPALSFSVCHPLVGNSDSPVNFLSGETLVGIYIGRFEYLKGADTLIEVVRLCIERGLPVRWKIYITTGGSDERMLTELGDTAEVVRDLPNEELLDSIRGADFLAFPSRSEGFGIAVLECMKRGIVPIARNIPIGVPDMVKEGESGFLVDNAHGMVKVIAQLCENREYLSGMKRAAFEYSRKFFDYEMTGRRFVECIEEMAQRPVRFDKEFISHEPKLAEIVMPEPVYRQVRRMYRKLRGGKKAIG